MSVHQKSCSLYYQSACNSLGCHSRTCLWALSEHKGALTSQRRGPLRAQVRAVQWRWWRWFACIYFVIYGGKLLEDYTKSVLSEPQTRLGWAWRLQVSTWPMRVDPQPWLADPNPRPRKSLGVLGCHKNLKGPFVTKRRFGPLEPGFSAKAQAWHVASAQCSAINRVKSGV